MIQLQDNSGQFRSNIKKMYIFKFLVSLHFFSAVLMPFFLEWGKISYTKIMILQSFFTISVFLLEVPTGAVADYLGRKTSLIFAVIAAMAGAIVYTAYPSFYLFMAGEFLFALSASLTSGADQALVYDSLKKIKQEKKSKKVFGRFSSFEMIGMVTGAPIGSIIAATMGVRYPLLLITIPLTIALLISFTFKEPKTKKKIESRRYIEYLFRGVKYFKRHRILKILAFDRISIAVLVFFVVWAYQLKLMQIKVPVVYFGLVHAIAITGIQIPFMNSFEKLEKIFGGKKKYLLWSAIISGIAFILLGLSRTVWMVVILLMAITGFGMTRFVLFQNYLNKHIKSENRATVLSTISMADRLMRALLYPLIGLLVEWSLNYTLMILGVLIIIFALISRVREEHLID